jgi:hypothetical protein
MKINLASAITTNHKKIYTDVVGQYVIKDPIFYTFV